MVGALLNQKFHVIQLEYKLFPSRGKQSNRFFEIVCFREVKIKNSTMILKPFVSKLITLVEM